MNNRFLLDDDYQVFSNQQLKFKTLNATSKYELGWFTIYLILALPLAIIVLATTFDAVRRDQAFRVQGREIDAFVLACEMTSLGRNGNAPELTYSYVVEGVMYEDIDTVSSTRQESINSRWVMRCACCTLPTIPKSRRF